MAARTRKAMVAVEKAKRQMIFRNPEGVTVKELRGMLEGRDEDAKVALLTDDFSQPYGLIGSITVIPGGGVILTEGAYIDPTSLYPTWVANILEEARGEGACDEIFNVANILLNHGATEEFVPPEFKEYKDDLIQYTIKENLPKAWKNALYSHDGETVIVYQKAIYPNFYTVFDDGEIEELRNYSSVSDFPDIGEEIESEDGSVYILGGILPDSADPRYKK